jgi:hypothetical protein
LESVFVLEVHGEVEKDTHELLDHMWFLEIVEVLVDGAVESHCGCQLGVV